MIIWIIIIVIVVICIIIIIIIVIVMKCKKSERISKIPGESGTLLTNRVSEDKNENDN